MDIDLLKNTPDDQIEMMLMSVSDGSYVDSPSMSFSTGAPTTAAAMQHLFDVQQQAPTLSFCNNNNSMITSPFVNGNGNGYGNGNTSASSKTSMAAMREMIFRIAAMQPIYIDPEAVKPPKRRNVRISKDPQSVAARHRRERISERIRILQRLVPGGTKMDTASMLDEAIHYVKFLKTQVQSLERAAIHNRPATTPLPVGFPVSVSTTPNGYFPVTGGGKANNTTSNYHL